MPEFSDHFSGVARAYQSFRPHYRRELFEVLAGLAPARQRAWDCGAGSGQAARGLREYFDQVIATDASVEQLLGCSGSGLGRVCCLAEKVALVNGCADLVTVAQALHWFRLDSFFAEVRRILRPGGVIAVWTYQLLNITPGLDEVIGRFYGQTLYRDWPGQRALVQRGYADLDFPFKERQVVVPDMWARWDLHSLVGYLSTWSAVAGYRKRVGKDPMPQVERELQERWPSGTTELVVTWPVAMRAGYI